MYIAHFCALIRLVWAHLCISCCIVYLFCMFCVMFLPAFSALSASVFTYLSDQLTRCFTSRSIYSPAFCRYHVCVLSSVNILLVGVWSLPLLFFLSSSVFLICSFLSLSHHTHIRTYSSMQPGCPAIVLVFFFVQFAFVALYCTVFHSCCCFYISFPLSLFCFKRHGSIVFVVSASLGIAWYCNCINNGNEVVYVMWFLTNPISGTTN